MHQQNISICIFFHNRKWTKCFTKQHETLNMNTCLAHFSYPGAGGVGSKPRGDSWCSWLVLRSMRQPSSTRLTRSQATSVSSARMKSVPSPISASSSKVRRLRHPCAKGSGIGKLASAPVRHRPRTRLFGTKGQVDVFRPADGAQRKNVARRGIEVFVPVRRRRLAAACGRQY